MGRKVGLLGAGFIAGFHVRALQRIPGLEIGWICDADRRKAEALAADIPGAKPAGALEEMLDEHPDAVHILLPPDAHASAALSCLAMDAHVFVEKPLATTAEDAHSIELIAGIMRRQVAVNHNLVFNATVEALLAAVRGRKLGELEHVAVTWNVPLRQLQAGMHGHWILQSPGNILLEQAVHPLSLVQLLLGDLVEASVLTSGAQLLSTGKTFHRTWQIALTCRRGTAQLMLSFGREFPEIRVFAIGQDGSMALDLVRNTHALRTHTFREMPLNLLDDVAEAASLVKLTAGNLARTLLGTVKARPAFDPFGDSIAKTVAAFYASLDRGETPVTGLARGRAVVDMCTRIGSLVDSGGTTVEIDRELEREITGRPHEQTDEAAVTP